ncbi:trimethylamine methyltransferase family protein [Tropicibacter sp. R16_0]|uniref:trimethylamine methyltransferase family protein n=1 Tax=Tropicibacter sp. R16_0 TaxID=2821102 RepID=UPI001ADD3913|nr:trimethylamine methyltransferase family protein [Tropicibacter sp. R16_0]MBO9451533.1 trimethylamine methyltransferase family protein [Tropicibacter sp. R16_0]
MARRARASRTRQTAPSGAPASPHIQRSLPFFDPLDPDQIATLEAQVDWIIQDVGIAFRDDPVALDLWREAGARIEDDTVRADAAWIRELCAKAPSQFTQLARNPERSVTIGGIHQVFAPIYGAPFVRDLEGGRRYGDMAAFEQLVKLTYLHPNLHHGGFVTCEPCDVPVSKRHLDMLFTHMTMSDKPHLGAITEMSRAQDSVDMAEIVFGAEVMEDNCVIMGNVNTNSPLLVDKVVTEAIRTYCGRGQGIVVVPFILSGAMGPVSTAASVAQAMAEAMMCCAYAQMIRPGAPFVLGNFLSSMSLKSGAPTFGMPEPVISNYAIGQLARRVGLPLRCGGSLTASKIEDAQAAYESADSMHSTMLAGANFVLHSAGWLEGGLCTGFEKLIMDADRLGSYQKVLGQGLDTSDEALARDAYGEVAPGGHFLGSGHTMRNYQTAFYEPALSDSENVESWEEGGSKDMRRRAYERWNAMLDAYQPPAMDQGLREELAAYVARRKEELPDAWY